MRAGKARAAEAEWRGTKPRRPTPKQRSVAPGLIRTVSQVLRAIARALWKYVNH